MKPYYADDLVTLHHGDCLEVLAAMEESSVAAVVTDPPYGLEFMSVGWDTFAEPKGGPSLNPRSEWGDFGSREHPRTAAAAARVARNKAVAYQEFCNGWAAECFRVLKPGSYLLAFSGTRTYHRMACAIEDSGFEIRDSLHWLYGSGFPKGKACLKPSHEPIVMARKPDRYSTALPGLDGCRVGADIMRESRMSQSRGGVLNCNGRDVEHGNWQQKPNDDPAEHEGRWPPNILFTHSADCNGDCAPGCPVAELDRQSGVTTSSGGSGIASMRTRAKSVYGGKLDQDVPGAHLGGLGDTGGASRFYPTFRYQAKAPKSERPRLPDGTAWPTVKPLALMRWLVRLVTPPGGTVLDPFAGTGTTGQAAALEGFPSLLIERDPVAVGLALQRLRKPVQQQMTLCETA